LRNIFNCPVVFYLNYPAKLRLSIGVLNEIDGKRLGAMGYFNSLVIGEIVGGSQKRRTLRRP